MQLYHRMFENYSFADGSRYMSYHIKHVKDLEILNGYNNILNFKTLFVKMTDFTGAGSNIQRPNIMFAVLERLYDWTLHEHQKVA
jgi:hypothetical protein